MFSTRLPNLLPTYSSMVLPMLGELKLPVLKTSFLYQVFLNSKEEELRTILDRHK
jgi:hypothetical protein